MKLNRRHVLFASMVAIAIVLVSPVLSTTNPAPVRDEPERAGKPTPHEERSALEEPSTTPVESPATPPALRERYESAARALSENCGWEARAKCEGAHCVLQQSLFTEWMALYSYPSVILQGGAYDLLGVPETYLPCVSAFGQYEVWGWEWREQSSGKLHICTSATEPEVRMESQEDLRRLCREARGASGDE